MPDAPQPTPSGDDIEAAVRRHLDELDAAYELVRIDPAFANTAEFCARYGYAGNESGNCIVVVSKTQPKRYAACLVQATRRLDVNRCVRRLLGVRKASFASPQEATTLTGMVPDGVTPFGLPPDLPIYIDDPIAHLRRVVVGGGSRALKVLVHPEVFDRLPNASYVANLGQIRD